MKKQIALSLACLMGLSTLTACGGEKEAAAAASSDKITIKLATVISETHPSYMAFEHFKEELESKSEGRFEVVLYGSGQLGTQDDCVDQLRLGDVQMGTVNPVVMSSTIGALAITEEFYVFDDLEHAYAVFDGEAGQFIYDAFQAVDAQGVGFLPLGYANFTNSKHSVESLDDFNDIKIRGYSPIQIAAFEALGCTTATVSWNELFTSLQQKMIDGTSLAPSSMVMDKFSEVCEYYSLTEHEFGGDVLLVSTKFLDTLSEEDQALVTETAAEACAWLRPISEEETAKNLQIMKDGGAIVNEVPDEVKAEMAELMRAATEPLIIELAGQEAYDEFHRLVDEARG